MNGALQRLNGPPSTLHSKPATPAPGVPMSKLTFPPLTTGAAPGGAGVSGGGPSTVHTCWAGDASTAP